jgi:arsenate reductase (thioredoxin)
VAEPLNVLFLCTGNSARSIMAEAAINHSAVAAGRFRGFSAGSHPKGHVHPLTLAVLTEQRIPIDGLRSKSWDEFSGPDAPHMHFVFTVCDHAAAETCPIWPGHPVSAHWGVPDPAGATGSEARQRRAFREAYIVLARRVDQFASLPFDTLSALELKERLEHIGHE